MIPEVRDRLALRGQPDLPVLSALLGRKVIQAIRDRLVRPVRRVLQVRKVRLVPPVPPAVLLALPVLLDRLALQVLPDLRVCKA